MTFKKNQKLSNIAFLTTLIIIGIIFVSFGLIIKKSDRQAVMAQETVIRGYRISPPLSLDAIKNVTTSSIEWEADTPAGTSIIIETAVTESSSDLPASWSPAVNAGPIPGIENGADLTGKFLWTKQTLTSNDPVKTPRLKSLTETIVAEIKTEGHRISPEFDISGQNIIKDSRIFWQANERFDGNIDLKVNVFAEGLWSYEQEVVNGGQIPGLQPGTSLLGAKIQTKATFVGGPHFYPSLENIKIFVEIE